MNKSKNNLWHINGLYFAFFRKDIITETDPKYGLVFGARLIFKVENNKTKYRGFYYLF